MKKVSETPVSSSVTSKKTFKREGRVSTLEFRTTIPSGFVIVINCVTHGSRMSLLTKLNCEVEPSLKNYELAIAQVKSENEQWVFGVIESTSNDRSATVPANEASVSTKNQH